MSQGLDASPPAGAADDFLATPLADALCVLLFAGAAAWLRWELLPLLLIPAAARAPLGLAVALLGPVACGVERGLGRPPGRAAALALGLLCGAAHAGASAWLAPGRPAWMAGGEAAGLAVLGALAARFAVRFDRGEAGWREALRRGPPGGTPGLALAIAAARAPRWVELPLLPISWALRLPPLLAIRLYQLTLSRLMPSACRFEPTCSRYGYLAFRRHGCLKGGLLTGLRVLRCSPLSDGGLDPVPGVPGPEAPPGGPEGACGPGLSEARLSSAGRVASGAGPAGEAG